MIVPHSRDLGLTSRDISIRVDITVLINEPESETRFDTGTFTRPDVPEEMASELVTCLLSDLPTLIRKSALPNSHSYKIPVVTRRAEPLTVEIPHRLSTPNAMYCMSDKLPEVAEVRESTSRSCQHPRPN